MEAIVLIVVLAVLYSALLRWACKTLPGEKWQVMATLPVARNEQGWSGINITYYGFFQASASALALTLVLFMLGTLGLDSGRAFLTTGPLLAAGMWASSHVARIVEKKPATFTVAGGAFTGLLLAPPAIWVGRRFFGVDLGLVPFLSALAVGYAFGEGLGRLACISFGCCYGKALSDLPAWVQKLVKGRGFVFSGPTKKVCYEGGLEGTPVLPIQALTSAVNVGLGLAGLYLFLTGRFTAALLLVLPAVQLWRLFSETLRADYRGGGRLTAYQIMALASIPIAAAIVLLFPGRAAMPRLASGLDLLWGPEVLLGVEAAWVVVLLYVGRSKVTGADIRFHLIESRI
ncbi:MAG: prolipoprotein diacylglyceryl transferase [Proteobacteria bacterium]|nr:prolipoprotein diacylglyceryl transferase [Pseudomonadota bacterium]